MKDMAMAIRDKTSNKLVFYIQQYLPNMLSILFHTIRMLICKNDNNLIIKCVCDEVINARCYAHI